MFKNLRQKVKDEGAINVGAMALACLTIIGGLVSVIYANASQRITTLEVKADTFQIDITTLKANTADIPNMRDKLDAVYAGLLKGKIISPAK